MKEAHYKAFLHQSGRTALELNSFTGFIHSLQLFFQYFCKRKIALWLPCVTMTTQATERFKEKDIISPSIKSSMKCDKGNLSPSSRGSLLISEFSHHQWVSYYVIVERESEKWALIPQSQLAINFSSFQWLIYMRKTCFFCAKLAITCCMTVVLALSILDNIIKSNPNLPVLSLVLFED